MRKKLNRIYDVLVEGASAGLKEKELFKYITKKHPDTSAKKVVKASLFALSDPDVRDRDVLEAVYSLAISYRLSSLGEEHDAHDDEDDVAHAPSVSEALKSRLESSTSEVTVSHFAIDNTDDNQHSQLL